MVSKKVFCRCGQILINQLKRWAYCRHTDKSRRIFGFEYECGGIKNKFTLQKLSYIPIRRHVKVKCEANPFASSWDTYFEKRKRKYNCQSIIRKVLVQEKELFKGRKVSDRIVNIDRHYVCPIIRGGRN